MNSIQASPDYPIKEPDRRLNLKEFSEISTSEHRNGYLVRHGSGFLWQSANVEMQYRNKDFFLFALYYFLIAMINGMHSEVHGHWTSTNDIATY